MPHHPRWILQGLGGEPLIVQRFDAPRDPGHEALPRTFVFGYLDGWLLDGQVRPVLLDIYAATFGLRPIDHFEAHGVDPALRSALEGAFLQEILVVLFEQRTASPIIGTESSPPSRPSSNRPQPTQTSFYEIVVFDELEAPIVNVRMVVTTPAGTVTRTTDGSGRVRVDGVPPGFGSARIASQAELATVMAGRERRPRRTQPLPEGEPWNLRLATSSTDSVVLPDADPQKLMIITRTDLFHFASSTPWKELSLAEKAPARLATDDSTTLQLHANAAGAEAIVVGPETAAPAADSLGLARAPASADGPEWLRIAIDTLHEALFRGSFDTVWRILESIPLDLPPPPAPALLPPLAEELVFQAAMAELALAGHVDAPAAEDPEQV